MADEEIKSPQDSAEDRKFREGRVWHSFKAVLYSGLSAASFIGALHKLVDMTVSSVQPVVEGAAQAAGKIAPSLAHLPTLGVLASVLVVGGIFTYLAQQEWTEVKLREDERLARKNAECMAKQQSQTITVPMTAVTQHFDNPGRADGKPWAEACKKQDVTLTAQR